ncbi:proton-coupled zinc antiporter SLC30A2-like [Artemia franciscana]|uniref:Zinc transporter 2 n=1 Tax=Artemia franciscana TaxID=6661 RepID=A0AA88H4T7_ARTSF|nr:hypothetical protein QYM36_018249 [Artemia franciscana]KAK2703265.1 hypothetical protein QYM36_018249 [Artemia franciscana]KAK2703266.1 hypothetical protein QYM36_018249 [Artemia franciscana]KAK2703267.1 hypothetical protein QYM36_018249 [Artemia franciscana]
MSHPEDKEQHSRSKSLSSDEGSRFDIHDVSSLFPTTSSTPVPSKPRWSDIVRGQNRVASPLSAPVGHFQSPPRFHPIGSRSLSDLVDAEKRIRRYSVSLHDNTITELKVDDEGDDRIGPIMECLCETGVCLVHSVEGIYTKSADDAVTDVLNKKLRRKLMIQNSSPPASMSADASDFKGDDTEYRFVDMSHCHSNLSNIADKRARRKLIIASTLCLLFMIGEAVGGYLANSLAIATDAAHLLSDFASFMISLFSLYIATRPATQRMSFGYYRAEVLGALTSVFMIWVITAVLVYVAIERIMSKSFEVDAIIMLITSGVGVAVNILMGLTLHQHGHSHTGAVDDTSPLLEAHTHNGKSENIIVTAAFIHVLGDLIQSVGVFIASLVLYFQPTWVLVDPICTFIFSFLVLLTTVTVMRDVLQVLMEGMPKGIDFNEVMKTFKQIKGVQQVHNLRIWALSLDKCALSAHLAVDPDASSQDILSEATRLVRSKFDFFEMALQIEHFRPHMDNCQQCRNPLV